jgi:hypothetical protein
VSPEVAALVDKIAHDFTGHDPQWIDEDGNGFYTCPRYGDDAAGECICDHAERAAALNRALVELIEVASK